MRVLFASAEPAYPDVFGGGVLNIHHLATAMRRRGVDCAIAASAPHGSNNRITRSSRYNRTADTIDSGIQAAFRRIRTPIWKTIDTTEGYTLFKAPPRRVLSRFPTLIGDYRPDLVISQGLGREALATMAASADIPCIIRAVCAECVDSIASEARDNRNFGSALRDGRINIVSNSRFISDRVGRLLGLDSLVLYEMVPFELCMADEHDPQFVTFVNPSQVKGVSIALEIAELLPHRRFVFQEAWPLDPRARAKLLDRIRQLGNVQLRPPTKDMREVYASTSLLLMPSQWEEAFGRVALEACVNGIPVVASEIGGIPESVGDGGILLNRDSPGPTWSEAIEVILSDPATYSRLGIEGRRHAQKELFTETFIVDGFLNLAENLKESSR